MSLYFIAEAGVNHNGDKELAYQLIDAAVAAGADAVKFQTFKADALASSDAPKAKYQSDNTDASESQLEMLRRLELPYDWHVELRDYCQQHGIDFLSTPFDSSSLHFLVNELGLETIKVPSGELTNGPFLLEVAQSGCQIILSTGMSTLNEVAEALGVLAFGLSESKGKPSRDTFKQALMSEDGRAALLKNVTVLHCTSAYPAPLCDANISAIQTLRETFGLKTGFSDHTNGMIAALGAAALGADVIEKHYTLDREFPGPDHKASLNPIELKSLINDIHLIETSLGDGVKAPRPSEIETINVARKSLVAVSTINAGDTLSVENIGAKRPGDGISPMEYWDKLETPYPRQLSDGDKL